MKLRESADTSSNPEEQTPKPFGQTGGRELGETARKNSESGGNQPEKKTAEDRREIFRALEVVERNSSAIAESYDSLFSTLRLALSEVTSNSIENMQCFSDVVGSLQVAALDAATKGNRYINSCLRLNEELKSMESLALEPKMLRKNVDKLEVAVNHLLRLP
ncbi:uncharacterized protein LOC110025126 [Phalaenopsis equestris]|uniref:uncharacterized protein LOC110025126 n=1 Tax=Phalaenopsis equestris TaxID=78828 RepID=UPI0009E3E5AA|nr:uncharacterized protein LOC110025126 [Phalaenopsis equestris]